MLKAIEQIERDKDTMKKSVKNDSSIKRIKEKRPYASPEFIEYGDLSLLDATKTGTGPMGEMAGKLNRFP